MRTHALWALITLIALSSTGIALADAVNQSSSDLFPDVPSDVLQAAEGQGQSSSGSSAYPGVPSSVLNQNTVSGGGSGDANTSVSQPGSSLNTAPSAAESAPAQAEAATSASVPTNPVGSLTNEAPGACHVVDGNGTVLSNIAPGLDAAGGIAFPGAPAFSVRCDGGPVSNGSATTPVLAGPFGDSAALPGAVPLSVNATVMPVVPDGAQNAVVAVLSLDAQNAHSPLTLNAIPLTLAENGVASDFSAISSCSVTDASAGTQLAGAIQPIGGGAADFILHTPLTIAAGHASTLVMRCSFSASMHIGMKFRLAFPAPCFAAQTVSGAVVTPVQGTTITGAPSTNTGIVTVVAPTPASTTSTPQTTPTYEVPRPPGMPETGAGGGSETVYTLLVGSSILALIASVYALIQLREMRKDKR